MREPVPRPTRDFLAHRAAATPDRTAVVATDRGREWTYRGLDAAVDTVASQFAEHVDPTRRDGGKSGVQPRVACLLGTRVAFVATFYAAMRLGWTLAPVHTDLATPEVGSHLDRVEPSLLVCEAATEPTATEAVEARGWPVLSVDSPESAGTAPLRLTGDGTDSVEPVERDPDETAAILFTSGTTGDPRGVRLTLGNLAASATASAFRLGVQPGDRWLCCLPVSHMGGLAPTVRSVLYGTTLVLQRSFDAERTARALAEQAATGVSLVPTQLTRLLDAGWSPPSTLRTVLVGGAPATETLRERALEAGVPIHPTYGMTETASQVATATPGDVREHPGTVGQPLVFTDVTVLADGEPAGPGERGELVVDGPTVAPGYLDSEATERAVGERGLHTGDVGYRDGDGRLWVVGRRDDTILTGGELVVPSEVESALRAHPGVADVTVVGLPDEEWGERVAALVVPDGEEAPDAAALREHCRDRLAAFKLPKTVRAVEELPRTGSGTVDRERARKAVRNG